MMQIKTRSEGRTMTDPIIHNGTYKAQACRHCLVDESEGTFNTFLLAA